LTTAIVYTNTYFKIKFQTGTYFDSTANFDIYFPDGMFTDSGKTMCFLLTYNSIGFYCTFTNFASGYLEKVTLFNPCPFTCASTTS